MEKINNKKLILLLPLLCFLILTVVTIYLSCNYSVEGINEYEKKLSEDYIHFSLDELGNYDNVAFSCKKTGGILFSSYGSMLVAEYSGDEFKNQLKAVNALAYQTEYILFEETKYSLPEASFSINEWNFRILESKSENYTIPKDIDLIAVNKSEKKIAYLSFCDQDIDYLCTVDNSDGYMQKFVKKYFNLL
jgi:hypothetical protein